MDGERGACSEPNDVTDDIITGTEMNLRQTQSLSRGFLPGNVDFGPSVVCDERLREVQPSCARAQVPQQRNLPMMHLYRQEVLLKH